MSDRASRAQQTKDQSLLLDLSAPAVSTTSLRLAQRLRRRGFWIAALGLAVVSFSAHWVWALIAALFTLFLVFAVDDEVKELERDT